MKNTGHQETMDGLELSKIIMEKFQVPILFLTAFEDENTISKILKLIKSGYIVKPFNDEDLKAV